MGGGRDRGRKKEEEEGSGDRNVGEGWRKGGRDKTFP